MISVTVYVTLKGFRNRTTYGGSGIFKNVCFGLGTYFRALFVMPSPVTCSMTVERF